MPYGPTKFVNGQNQGAAPVNTQVLGNDIQVILPGGIRIGEGRVPDAAGLTTPARRAAPAPPSPGSPPCCHRSSSFRRCSTD